MKKKIVYRRESVISKDPARLSEDIYVPSCIFSKELSSFESIVKFLKENYGLSFVEISKLMDKKKQSVWRAYKLASSKQKGSLNVTNLYYPVPITEFEKGNTILESLVLFFKEKYHLTNAQISALLQRDDRTIYTVIARNRRKHEK